MFINPKKYILFNINNMINFTLFRHKYKQKNI